MFFLTLSVSPLEITMLAIGAIALGCAIYFFKHSQESLRQTMQAAGKAYNVATLKPQNSPSPFSFRTAANSGKATARPAVVTWPEPLSAKPPLPDAAPLSVQSVVHFKASLQQQQTVLHQLLHKIEALESGATDDKKLQRHNDDLQAQMEALELALLEKESELKQARQQEAVARHMAARIDEVYNEFDLLQQKIDTLEAQVAGSNGLMLELEDLQQAHEQLRQELLYKQDKIDELTLENGRLLQELNATEDKLDEMNTQRQRLMNHTQVLQTAHTGSYNTLHSNAKLQKELRRIGELESMLSIITHDRMRAAR